MNLRLRVMESLQAAAEGSETCHPHNRLLPASISSFSSSDLDTESTKSFFQESARVSLGRIIRIRPGDGDLYFTRNPFHHGEQEDRISDSFRSVDGAVPRGVCIPFLQSVCEKMSLNKNNPR
ncbi:hypothetical protein ACHQM5_017583 [Ranunculus cassubicifolius]